MPLQFVQSLMEKLNALGSILLELRLAPDLFISATTSHSPTYSLLDCILETKTWWSLVSPGDRLMLSFHI